MSDSAETKELKGSTSSSSLLTRVDSSSILTRVESFTSEPRPALALVQFAEKLGNLSQQLPKQRLGWSKQSARLRRQLAAASEETSEDQCQPLDVTPPKTGSAPSSGRRQFRRPRASEMRSAPVSARTSSAPSTPRIATVNCQKFGINRPQGARPTLVGARPTVVTPVQEGQVLTFADNGHHLWPHMANVAERARLRQAQSGRGGRHVLQSLPVSQPETGTPETLPRTPSSSRLMRLAEACTEAGLFIIPSVSETPADVPRVFTRHHSFEAAPSPLPIEPSTGDSEAGSSTGTLGKLFDKFKRETPTNELLSAPGMESSRPSTSMRWSFAVSRLMEERSSNVKAEQVGQLQEVIRQAMSKEISEQPKAEHRDREKRLRWQQQHMQMISQLQELNKTLHQLQPQDHQEMAEPLQMLKKMMGIDNKDKQAEKAHAEKDDGDDQEGPPLAIRSDDRQSISSRKLRFDAISMETSREASRGSISTQGLSKELLLSDPADLSLPPLCGHVEIRKNSVRRGSVPKEPCTLARSCCARKRGRRYSTRGSPLPNDSDGSPDEDMPPEHEVGRIFRKFKHYEDLFDGNRRRSERNSRDEGHTRDDIKQKWKKNLALVRMFGRMSQHPIDRGGDMDLMHELASMSHILSHDEALRLSVQNNLPIDRVVKCRKLFARYDKENRGELGPEEVQNVLREMWKDMHPKLTALPHALFSSPSAWGSRTKFTEVLRWLSRHAFDEASLVPPEQQRAREFARQWGVPVADVEEVKDLFDRFDSERTGFLDFNSFKSALSVILKVPRGIDVPTSRCNIFWKEVDQGKTGNVSFESFFWWYKRSGFNEPGHRASFVGASSGMMALFRSNSGLS